MFVAPAYEEVLGVLILRLAVGESQSMTLLAELVDHPRIIILDTQGITAAYLSVEGLLRGERGANAGRDHASCLLKLQAKTTGVIEGRRWCPKLINLFLHQQLIVVVGQALLLVLL